LTSREQRVLERLSSTGASLQAAMLTMVHTPSPSTKERNSRLSRNQIIEILIKFI
jgi:hypothetical protein